MVKLNQFDNLHHSNQLVVISYENNLSRLASFAFQKMSIISYSNSYFLLLMHSTSMQSPKYCSFDRSIWTRNHRPSIHSIFVLLSLMNLPTACSGFGLCAECLRLIGGSVMGSLLLIRILSYGVEYFRCRCLILEHDMRYLVWNNTMWTSTNSSWFIYFSFAYKIVAFLFQPLDQHLYWY